MAKFHGKVGFGHNTLVRPGVYKDVITEKSYFGDVTRNSRQLREGEKVNSDLTVSNSIEIVADAYLSEHFFAIRYVEWAGSLWTVRNITVQRPRLLMELGGVYDGERAPGSNPGTSSTSGSPAGL